MIVIDLNGGLDGVTADLTTITVDLTTITVDNNNTSTAYTIKYIPRDFTENVKLIFRNELTNIETIIETTMIESNGLAYSNFSFEIEDKSSFELTILKSDNNDLLYRGKAFATFETDLENYKMTKPNENNKIIM
jgi:hypothetical protein